MAELRLNGEMNLLSTRYRVSSDCACRFKRQKWMVEVLRETSSDIGRIGLTGEKRELLPLAQQCIDHLCCLCIPMRWGIDVGKVVMAKLRFLQQGHYLPRAALLR